jgi:hypothetical protein
MSSDDLLPDRWFAVDRRVLLAVAEQFAVDHLRVVASNNVAVQLELDPAEVARSMHLLYRAGYLAHVQTDFDGAADASGDLTQRGLEAVGLWPTDDSIWQRTLEHLDASIAAETRETERSRLTKVRDALVAAGRDVVVGLVTAGVAVHIPR